MYNAKVTSKGQITVPMYIRERLKLTEGSIVNFSINRDEEVVMKKDTVSSILDAGTRVFFQSLSEACFECFPDKTLKPVDHRWLYDEMSRNKSFRYIMVYAKQIQYLVECIANPAALFLLAADSIEFYYTYGLLAKEHYDQYHANKRIRDLRTIENQKKKTGDTHE
ncbi:AbrB family looped-hinge helix DNA binding protein [Paenibacillus mucilaginosus]|uniref:AbrB/MazE/SpoVT family DNA-binding domain-containing protein n=1 Tax=Paenibacillus mucilaginosus TaxID=61624 RepID=UPI003D1E81CE